MRNYFDYFHIFAKVLFCLADKLYNKAVNMTKLPKLISGKMNIPYIVCKAGYAIGVRRPRRVLKPKLFNPIVILRKQEFKQAA